MGSKQWGHGYYTGLKEAEKKFKEGTEIKEREREWELALARAGIPYRKNPITFEVDLCFASGFVGGIPFHPEFYLPTVYVDGKRGIWMAIEGNAYKLAEGDGEPWSDSWLEDVILEFSGQTSADCDLEKLHFEDPFEKDNWDYALRRSAQYPCILVPDYPKCDNPAGKSGKCWTNWGIDNDDEHTVAIVKSIEGEKTYTIASIKANEKNHALSPLTLREGAGNVKRD